MKQHNQTMESIAYTNFCSAFNLKPEWLGEAFKTETGRSYTITGLNIRSRKFPVLTKQGSSFNADYVRALMTDNLEIYKKEREEKRKKQLERTLQSARHTYLKSGGLYGLKKEWLDKSFVGPGRGYRGRTYTIVGLEYGRQADPHIIVRRDDGKLFNTPTTAVIERMKDQKAA